MQPRDITLGTFITPYPIFMIPQYGYYISRHTDKFIQSQSQFLLEEFNNVAATPISRKECMHAHNYVYTITL